MINIQSMQKEFWGNSCYIWCLTRLFTGLEDMKSMMECILQGWKANDFDDDGEIYTIEMKLSRPNIDKFRGYKWTAATINVDPIAVTNVKELSLLEELIEIITLSTTSGLVWNSVERVSEIEKIICNNYPTVETYFKQLPLLKNGKTNYWYLASSKEDVKFSLDEYEYALRKYTGDNAWHVSDITEHGKRSIVYEFTNTYDDLYY